MTCRGPIVSWLVLLLVVGLSGCGWWGDSEESAFDDTLPEFSSPDDPMAEPVTIVAESSATATDGQPAAQLQVGDSFPLMKRVVQTLSQPTPHGKQTSETWLELQFTVSVDEIRDDRTRFGVWYHRVRYSQDIAGEKFEFDSDAPPNPIPVQMRAYQGMVRNGFSFWIGSDNRVIEPVGFDEFLQQCVANVPQQHRRAVMQMLIETSGEKGIASFVDNSIGLLAGRGGLEGQDTSWAPGQTWTREDRLAAPFPMHVSNEYLLKSLTPTQAEIEVIGEITPIDALQPTASRNGGVSLQVRRGHSSGSCTIDRTTGLPIRSEVEQHLEMIVKVHGGEEFEQQKKTVTIVQAMPQNASEFNQTAAHDEPSPAERETPLRISAEPRGSGLR